jgi:RHH-type rel operon transcriptional repressor/antitoxin RelB
MLPLRDICDILNTNILKESCMATSIRLNHEIEQRLDRLSAETGRTKAFYLRELIERGLEDLEDYYLGMEVLERLRKGEEHTVSLDEAEKDLGLDD